MKLFLFCLLYINISFGQVVQEVYLCESTKTEYTYYYPSDYPFPNVNAFTPNQDLNNNLFDVKGHNIKSFHMLIYNRWGELIYETFSLDEKWDGYYNGQLVQEDVYVYTALWQDIKLKWGSKTGIVTILY